MLSFSREGKGERHLIGSLISLSLLLRCYVSISRAVYESIYHIFYVYGYEAKASNQEEVRSQCESDLTLTFVFIDEGNLCTVKIEARWSCNNRNRTIVR